MKIALLKLIDKIVGIPATWLLSKPRYKAAKQPKKILLIRPGGIGDAALLVPAITALKIKFPEAAIDILAEKRNSEVFLLCPETGNILHYDKPHELIAAIRGNYDVVIDTEQWHRLSAVVARLIRAPMTIGFATNDRKKLFTHPVIYSHDDYEVNSFMNLVNQISVQTNVTADEPFLTIPEASRLSIRTDLEVPDSERRIISFFPGSSIPERRWGSDRFHGVARLLSERGYRVVVVGGSRDVGEGKEIIQDLPNSLNLCGKLALPETAAMLKESSLLITGDSGMLHIAAGLGTKTVALFGPGLEKKWAPRGGKHLTLNNNLACSPCTKFGYTPKCKINAACMGSITVEEVFRASMKLVEDSQDNREK